MGTPNAESCCPAGDAERRTSNVERQAVTNAFDSSDSTRSARPLPHAETVSLGPFDLELGGRLPEVDVCYETYGTLNAERSNAVLICHALSGDSHVARHDAGDDAGWWDFAVGPGKIIDTNQYFVVCPNILGGCRGTTGPSSSNPETGTRYGRSFPAITIGDMVEVQRRLLDLLGIHQLLAVVGGSMGGQQVLCWATRFPDRVKAAVAMATAPRISSQSLAFDIVGRNAILHDASFRAGDYYDTNAGPDTGLAIARMIGHITYLSREAMQEKFEADRYRPRDVPTSFEKEFSVGSYLGYQGAKFVERFDANSYITLTMAMDLFDLGSTPEQLADAFRATTCRWLFISFTSDWLFPAQQSRQMVKALIAGERRATYCNVPSTCGHDAFLLEDDAHLYGELIRAFLDNHIKPRCCNLESCIGSAESEGADSAVSIFQPDRLDYTWILDLIPADASVLDLGCGQGRLMCRLKLRGHTDVMGVELDESAILACVRNGQDVIHADLNSHLPQFRDGQFDVVVLSQTLQAVLDVEGVLGEMLRVGRVGIVSFPNFAYRKLREMLAEEGRAPEAPGVLRHKWYNTPNLRFLSIVDFEELCREKNIAIHNVVALDTEANREVTEDPNLNADLAIFVISRTQP